MRILFDLECTQPSNMVKRHGGGIYAERVFSRLVHRGADVVAFYNSSKWLNPEMKDLCDSNGVILADINETDIESIFTRYGCDRLFTALPSVDIISRKHLNPIGVVHGLRKIELLHDSYAWRYPEPWKRRIINLLTPIVGPWLLKRRKNEYRSIVDGDCVAVSDHTATAIRIWFPERVSSDVKVFYSPDTTGAFSTGGDPYDTGKYMLMVSGNRWDKNILRAIEAFEILFDAGLLSDIHVNITGLKSLDQLRYRFRHPDRFRALGYVDDCDLARLYRDAYGFVYPTLNEGFGYPPLEAMSNGVPVVASAVCSVPEVCGDAVLYFNPRDVHEIANRIARLEDIEVRNRLIERGYMRYKMIKERQNRDLDALCDYICRR